MGKIASVYIVVALLSLVMLLLLFLTFKSYCIKKSDEEKTLVDEEDSQEVNYPR